MNRNVLIVEDEQKIRDIIVDYFSSDGYMTFEAKDGIEALDVFEKESIDIVILDIMMPNLDGWSTCRRIRKKSDVIIIILTAREDEEDKLLGFELGADEYVTKPFSPKVLVARANTLIRRIHHKNTKEKTFVEKLGLKIDIEGRRVTIDDTDADLPLKEFDLLVYLVRNEGIVLTRDQILNTVWGYDFYGDTRVVDTTIKNIRKKTGQYGRFIHTIFRVGYKFEVRE